MKNKIINKIAFIALLMPITICLSAQENTKADPDQRTDWWDDVDGFLNQQAKETLHLVDAALISNPPELTENQTRKMALLMLDNVLHEEKAQHRQAVQAFYKTRIEKAVKEIGSVKVKSGAFIWKLYNHTFVVKTPSVTIGFDIQRGIPGNEDFTFSKEIMRKLIDVTDVLFITHFHNDHADKWVAETFIEQHKPVISAPGIWDKKEIYDQIMHPERTTEKTFKIELPLKHTSINTVICPGHQGDNILNNVYLVFTPEGMCFCHTGDQSNTDDMNWIDKIGHQYRIDVLMMNSWSYYPDLRVMKGFNPKLTIPGHENELNHSIDHREPYWLNYKRLGNNPAYPWMQMATGEKYHYMKGNHFN